MKAKDLAELLMQTPEMEVVVGDGLDPEMFYSVDDVYVTDPEVGDSPTQICTSFETFEEHAQVVRLCYL